MVQKFSRPAYMDTFFGIIAQGMVVSRSSALHRFNVHAPVATKQPDFTGTYKKVAAGVHASPLQAPTGKTKGHSDPLVGSGVWGAKANSSSSFGSQR